MVVEDLLVILGVVDYLPGVLSGVLGVPENLPGELSGSPPGLWQDKHDVSKEETTKKKVEGERSHGASSGWWRTSWAT